jgi:hypothetical protein
MARRSVPIYMRAARDVDLTRALSDQLVQGAGAHYSYPMNNPFKRLNSSPEIIRLAVMMCVRYPMSLRNV